MDYKFMFGDLPLKVYPYNFDNYLKRNGKFIIVATNCQTGKSEYFDKQYTKEALLDVCKASCSLPFVCKYAQLNGIDYLDGGISDVIPIRKAQKDGFKKAVIVLTRNYGYRKSEKKFFFPKCIYKKYPKLREALISRNARYNEVCSYIEKLEESGEVIVIRPENKLQVNRLEDNPNKLEALYKEGYKQALKYFKK